MNKEVKVSPNQERAAKEVAKAIKSKKLIEGKSILAEIGYGKGIQKNPKMVFGSKGFKEALKRLGFSIEAADLTIAKILRTGKEENQIKASQEIYKRTGAYAKSPEDEQSKVNITFILNSFRGLGNKELDRKSAERISE